MELSWLMKLRIAAAAAVGVVLIGFLAWPLAAPTEPFGVVSLVDGNVTSSEAIILLFLGLLAGFVAYFLAWPFGREIGILAVPAGLAVWAVRCGGMADLMRLTPTVAQRQQVFSTLKWEPLFWLAIVAAGFCGTLLAGRVAKQKTNPATSSSKSNSKANIYLNTAVALAGSVLAAQFFIKLLAQNVEIPDSRLGSVMVRPSAAQIVFAVLVSFALTAFLVKKFLNAGYIWPIIASALVTGFSLAAYTNEDVLQHIIEHWPPVFFSNPVIAILPVQMVAFGAIGSIAGYWMAVRYNYWRKHEMNQQIG